MKNEEIDKLFRDHIDKLDIQPSADIWNKIEADLDEQKIVPIKKKIKWLKPLVSIAATLICIGIFSLLVMKQSASTVETTNIVNRKKDTATQKEQKEPVEDLIETKEEPVRFAVKTVPEKTQDTQTDYQIKSMPPKIAQINEAVALKKLKITAEQPMLVVVDSQAQIAHAMEYIPIKPIIENPDEEESMMASISESKQNVVTKVLNILSKTINQGNGSEVQFSNDDEGTLQIDLLNSLVKNKKRKK